MRRGSLWERETVLTMVDLFAGCGGVTEGFKACGFVPLAAVEFDGVAASTYRLNHPGVVVYTQDIRCLPPDVVMRDCGLESGQLTVLCACAPCQPFSTYTRGFSADDQRVPLLLEAIKFVEEMRPVFFFSENVPGMASRGKDILARVLDELRALGYKSVVSGVVNAADYGVPQMRKRFIVLATTLDVALGMPETTHANPLSTMGLNRVPWRTVRDAFAGLPEAGTTDDPLHVPPKMSQIVRERLEHARPGGSLYDLPAHLIPKRFFENKRIGYRDIYTKLRFDAPSCTVTGGCQHASAGRFGHPALGRCITLREAARLQTFPDSYRFCGSRVKIANQIGNAVPVELARVFACHIRHLYEEQERRP